MVIMKGTSLSFSSLYIVYLFICLFVFVNSVHSHESKTVVFKLQNAQTVICLLIVIFSSMTKITKCIIHETYQIFIKVTMNTTILNQSRNNNNNN